MRFVELRPSPDGEGIPLHPRIALLRGLDPAARVAVVGMAHDLALGQVPDWDGKAEIDGSECSLAEAVARMGETADCALIVPADSLPDVRGPDRVDPEAASRAHEAAAARVEELDTRRRGLAEELEAGGKVRSDMKARLASARARIDDAAGPALDRADAALLQGAAAAERPDPWTGAEDADDRRSHLEEVIAELSERRAGLPTGDRPALAAAIATARAALSTGPVPSPEAAALAQVWGSLHDRLAVLDSRLTADTGGPEVVAARLAEAREAARLAEDAAVPRKVLPEEEAHLEQLHEAMLEAERRAGRSVRKGAAKAAFERAVRALQDALDPLGYPTWAAFRMGNGMVCVTDEAVEAYERATAELAELETEWAAVQDRVDGDPELAEVRELIAEARGRVDELLGDDLPDDGDPASIADALRAHTVDAASLDAQVGPAVKHLRRTLDAAGAPGHADLRAEAALVVLGDSWLEVLAAADAARTRLTRDLERAEAELAAFAELGEGSRVDGLGELRALVHEAEATVAQSRQALLDRLGARIELHVLAATELQLAQEHDDCVTELESAQVLLDLAARRVEGSAAADAVTDLAARVPRGAGGPIPMVVVMGDAPAAKLDVLTAMPDDVQVLVVGEGTGVEDWLELVGPEMAAGVQVGARV